MRTVARYLIECLHRRPQLLRHRPNLDLALCNMVLKDRLRLPRVPARSVFPDEADHVVRIGEVPRGEWATPLGDVVTILKIAMSMAATRVLEVGSFRGYTAAALAGHLPDPARIVTIDMDPAHGEAYRGTPLAARIERRVGVMGEDILRADAPGSYDLAFIDGDHFYPGVMRDSKLVLPLLRDEGVLLWHDYTNWGYANAKNGVPECLHELAATLPIVHLAGTHLAAHRPCWAGSHRDEYERALGDAIVGPYQDPWTTPEARG